MRAAACSTCPALLTAAVSAHTSPPEIALAQVCAYNRTTEKVDRFLANEAAGTKIVGAHSSPELCSKLKKPRRVRRMRGRGASVGVEDLMEAYLRWVLAESRTVIGDLRRGQVASELDTWVAEVTCGETWAAVEARLSRQNAWTLLEDARDRVGRVPRVP